MGDTNNGVCVSELSPVSSLRVGPDSSENLRIPVGFIFITLFMITANLY